MLIVTFLPSIKKFEAKGVVGSHLNDPVPLALMATGGGTLGLRGLGLSLLLVMLWERGLEAGLSGSLPVSRSARLAKTSYDLNISLSQIIKLCTISLVMSLASLVSLLTLFLELP